MQPAGTRPHSPNPLAPLLDVAEALVSSLDLDEALARMTAVIGEAMQVSKVDVYTFDREHDRLIYEARWVGDDREHELPRLADTGSIVDLGARPSWRPILAGEIVEWHINDPDLPPEEREIYALADQKTTLDAPLIAGDTVIGVMGVVQRDRVRRFTPLERDLFGHFCRLAAIGIRNAQLLRRDNAGSAHLETLIDAGRLAAAGGDRAGILQKLARAAADGLGAATATIYAYDPGAETITCRARHPVSASVAARDRQDVPIPLAERPHERALLKELAPVVERIADPALDDDRREFLQTTGSAICVTAPVRAGGVPVGLLRLCVAHDSGQFGSDEVAVVEGIATQVALAMGNTR